MNAHSHEVSERDGGEPRQELLKQPERREIDAADERAHGAKLDGPGKHGAQDASLRRLNRYLTVLLIVVTLSVFSVVRQAGFVHWDDGVNIHNNPHIRGVTAGSLRWMFTDVSYIPRYMPLGWLSLAVDYDLVGEFNPATYHVGNLLLHCVNAVLVFALLKSLLVLAARRTGRALNERALLAAAAIGALFWAIHPLRAEPVAWASARIYCVASCFAFCAAAAYLRHATGAGGQGWLWLSATCFLASLLTYPIALGLVIVLVVIDFYPLRRIALTKNGLLGPAARQVWLEKVPFVLAGLGVAAATMWARTHSAQWIAPVSVDDFGIFARAMQVLYVWASYLWKTLAPINLTPMYTALVSFDPWSWRFMLSSVLVLGLSGVLLVQYRRWRGAAAIWICYLVLLVPMLGLTEHPHHANDRYSYIPGVLWSLVIAALLLRVWQRRERVMVLAACGAILFACGVASFRQASNWRNRETLLTYITSTLAAHPLRAPQDVQLGFVFRERGEYEKAEACFRQALEADPNYYDAHSSLADVLSERGNQTEAIAHYREALRIKSTSLELRVNFGIALGSAGQFNEAAAEFEQVVRAQPTNANAHHNLGITLVKLGRTDEATTRLQEAQRLRGAR
ncbi:MAG TPA: tetratricopeptide repeat protein [Candidatus Limnocylindria bacterium]|nr:tetratricopeptide repeat protein [Candidatus Limnocylindria bacterium]